MTHGRRSESGSCARLASIRPRSTRRIDRRRGLGPSRRATRGIGSRGRRPRRQCGLADERHRRPRRIRLPAGAAGGAAGRTRRPTGQSTEQRRFAAADEGSVRHAAGTGADAQSGSRRAAADLPLRSQGAHQCRARCRDRLRRAARLVLVEPFLRVGGQGQCPPDLRRLRTRGHPRERARPLQRHAAGRRIPSGDAHLSRQCTLDRPRLDCRAAAETRPQRKSGARDPRTAYARRAHGSTPRRTSPVSRM